MAIAEIWRKYDAIESRLTAGVSERILDLARVRRGMRVLDIASGRGEPALRAAARVGPEGSVVGFDADADVLAIAREKCAAEQVTNLELHAVDAEHFIFDGPFDAITERWGLMYMPAPVEVLAAAARALAPGARLVAAFWAEPERVPWSSLPRRARGQPAHRFRYADPPVIERDFAAAGLDVEHIEEMDVPIFETRTGEGIAEWALDFGFARDLSPNETRAWEADVALAAEPLRDGEIIRLGGVTRLVVATALGRRPSRPFA